MYNTDEVKEPVVLLQLIKSSPLFAIVALCNMIVYSPSMPLRRLQWPLLTRRSGHCIWAPKIQFWRSTMEGMKQLLKKKKNLYMTYRVTLGYLTCIHLQNYLFMCISARILNLRNFICIFTLALTKVLLFLNTKRTSSMNLMTPTA